MTVFVVVHGGWGGGWEWEDVARRLRGRGHEVFTPTLTGLGERAHLGRAGLGLSDHVEDVLAVLDHQRLDDVVLCGHSYGGMVVTAAADRAPERIRMLVYLDAFIPEDGESLLDLVPADVRDALLDNVHDGGVTMPPALWPPEGLLPDEVRSAYLERLQPHPVATITEPVALTGSVGDLSRAFVRCTRDDDLAPFAERALAEAWRYTEIDTPHDLQLFDPEGTASILDGLAAWRC